jgi:hypothetical protein
LRILGAASASRTETTRERPAAGRDAEAASREKAEAGTELLSGREPGITRATAARLAARAIERHRAGVHDPLILPASPRRVRAGDGRRLCRAFFSRVGWGGYDRRAVSIRNSPSLSISGRSRSPWRRTRDNRSTPRRLRAHGVMEPDRLGAYDLLDLLARLRQLPLGFGGALLLARRQVLNGFSKRKSSSSASSSAPVTTRSEACSKKHSQHASLYEAFPAAAARRLAMRVEWHYTPKHDTWLDMAESELCPRNVSLAALQTKLRSSRRSKPGSPIEANTTPKPIGSSQPTTHASDSSAYTLRFR